MYRFLKVNKKFYLGDMITCTYLNHGNFKHILNLDIKLRYFTMLKLKI